MKKVALLSILAFLCFIGMIVSAQADIIIPTSYDMYNGGTSGNMVTTLRDDTYNGSGNPNVDYSYLSGGVGDLTDGVVASGIWIVDPVPYVGWWEFFNPQGPSPVIEFHFAGTVAIDEVSIHFEGFYNPSSVDIEMGSTSHNFSVYQGNPKWVEFNSLGLSGNLLTLTLNDRLPDPVQGYANDWIIISEVKFESGSASIPEPTTMLLIGTGLVGLVVFRRQFRK